MLTPSTAPDRAIEVHPALMAASPAPPPVESVPLAGKLIEQPVPDTAGRYKPPTTVIDLIYRIWMTLEWSKTGQMVVVLLAAGLTVAVVFAGLGLLVHTLIGIPAVWSAVGGIVAGGGAAASTYGYVRRCQRRTASERARP
jgi:hypothetical protein